MKRHPLVSLVFYSKSFEKKWSDRKLNVNRHPVCKTSPLFVTLVGIEILKQQSINVH